MNNDKTATDLSRRSFIAVGALALIGHRYVHLGPEEGATAPTPAELTAIRGTIEAAMLAQNPALYEALEESGILEVELSSRALLLFQARLSLIQNGMDRRAADEIATKNWATFPSTLFPPPKGSTYVNLGPQRPPGADRPMTPERRAEVDKIRKWIEAEFGPPSPSSAPRKS